MIQFARRYGFAHGDEIRQLNHFALSAANVDVRQILGIAAVHVGDLELDVVLLGVAFEARHFPAAEHRFERTADFDDARADRGHFVAVHVDLQLRLVQFEIGVGVHQRGIVGEPCKNRFDVFVELFVRTGRFDDELDCQRTAARAAERCGVTAKARIPGMAISCG